MKINSCCSWTSNLKKELGCSSYDRAKQLEITPVLYLQQLWRLRFVWRMWSSGWNPWSGARVPEDPPPHTYCWAQVKWQDDATSQKVCLCQSRWYTETVGCNSERYNLHVWYNWQGRKLPKYQMRCAGIWFMQWLNAYFRLDEKVAKKEKEKQETKELKKEKKEESKARKTAEKLAEKANKIAAKFQKYASLSITISI